MSGYVRGQGSPQTGQWRESLCSVEPGLSSPGELGRWEGSLRSALSSLSFGGIAQGRDDFRVLYP